MEYPDRTQNGDDAIPGFFMVLLPLLASCLTGLACALKAGMDQPTYINMLAGFSEQLWDGDPYPRWIFDAVGGHGNPVFFFYFPLPYFIGGALHPLFNHASYLFISQYHASSLLAMIAAGAAAFAWMREYLPARMAGAFALLYLATPYAMDIIFIRGAMAELWAYAWMPLALKYSRRLAGGHAGAIAGLALAYALLLLSHIPAAIWIIGATTLYAVLQSRERARLLICQGLALALAGGITAFYLLPALYFSPYVQSEIISRTKAFPNHFITSGQLWKASITTLLPQGGVMLFAAYLAYRLLTKARAIADPFIRREIRTWAALFMLCLFILFPVSEPLLSLAGNLRPALMPYRINNLLAGIALYYIALYVRYIASSWRTWKSDIAAWWILAVLAGVLGGINSLDDYRLMEKSHFRYMPLEYQPRGVTFWDSVLAAAGSASDRGEDAMRAKAKQRLREYNAQPRAEIMSGAGDIHILQWRWDGIRLQVRAQSNVLVRIKQWYFPSWRATSAQGEVLPLRQEKDNGSMLLDLPTGDHEVKLINSTGDIGAIGGFISLCSAMFLCLTRWRTRGSPMKATG